MLDRIEPWHTLAFIRYNYYQNGFARDRNLRQGGLQTAQNENDLTDHVRIERLGYWSVQKRERHMPCSSSTLTCHFSEPGQVYEGHVHSDQGWNFTGYTRFGFPLPYVGHNENGGWVSTDNAADLQDVYFETFDDPARPTRLQIWEWISTGDGAR